jgi:hypothetical protein
MKMVGRAETGRNTREVGADINAVLIKSEHVLGALGTTVMYMDRNRKKVKS